MSQALRDERGNLHHEACIEIEDLPKLEYVEASSGTRCATCEELLVPESDDPSVLDDLHDAQDDEELDEELDEDEDE